VVTPEQVFRASVNALLVLWLLYQISRQSIQALSLSDYETVAWLDSRAKQQLHNQIDSKPVLDMQCTRARN